MKYCIYPFLLAILFISSSYASDNDVFSYDKEKMNQAFQEVNKIEDELLNNRETLSNLQFENNLFLNSNVMNQRADLFGQGPLGIDGFLWGCFLGPVGILIVAIDEQGKNQLKRSLLGCILGAIVWGGGWWWWGWR